MRTLHARAAGRPGRARTGFTLIELIVVLAIIALLVALAMPAGQKILENERNRASDNIMHKLQPALESEYEAVVKQCDADARGDKIPASIVAYCDGDKPRAQAVWTALQLRRQLPQTFDEATNSPVGFNIPELKPLSVFDEVRGLGGSAAEESAALLYIILAKKAAGSGSFAADELTQKKQKDLPFGARNLRVFTDGWDNPVGFSRWMSNTETSRMGDQKPGSARDPLDPRLAVVTWKQADGTPSPKIAQLNNAGLMFNNQYRLATVYSAGKDKQINPDFGGNNLAGYRIRELGKRGK